MVACAATAFAAAAAAMEMARVAGSEVFVAEVAGVAGVAEVKEVVGSIESEAAATGQVGEEEERASGLEAERSLRSCCMKAPGAGTESKPRRDCESYAPDGLGPAQRQAGDRDRDGPRGACVSECGGSGGGL